MELVSEQVVERGNPFRVFEAFFSYDVEGRGEKCESAIREIYNNNNFDSKVVLNNGHTIIGEDPRCFVMRGERYVLSQRYVGSFENIEQNIVNFDTGEASRYFVNEQNFNYGKNWTPFVFNDELYMIHSFDPLTILRKGDVACRIPTGLPGSGGSFGMFRGGSNGLQRGHLIFGIGHATVYPLDHRPTLWVIDTQAHTFSTAKLGDYDALAMFSLADPTSLWSSPATGEYYVAICESRRYWDIQDNTCATRIFKVDIDVLMSRMPSWPYYTTVTIPSTLFL